MDIVKDPRVDWLGYKWYFMALSIVLAVASVVGIFGLSGLNMGVDFTGGTLVYVKFSERPDIQELRRVLNNAGLAAEQVSRFDEEAANQVQIRMARLEEEEVEEAGEQLRDRGQLVTEVLHAHYNADIDTSGKLDLNAISGSRLAQHLTQADPENLAANGAPDRTLDVAAHYREIAVRITGYRTAHGGLIQDFSALQEVDVSEQVLEELKSSFYLGDFAVLSVESVGPRVGQEMRDRAQQAILFSLLGMLIYIAIRFQTIYGLAALAALFHDVFITLGAYSWAGEEISLTVVAALLTLVGYSINDTIVIFDRVRENTRLMRRADMKTIINTSINQTLNRTILTSGGTFLAVLSLYLLGGEALSAFSFGLLIGILVGTYSSIAIASPIVLWWHNFRAQQRARA